MTTSPFIDVSGRNATRVVFLYGLTGGSPVEESTTAPMTDAFAYGRFTSHLEAASRLLPRIRLLDELHGDALTHADGSPLACFSALRILLAATPRGDATLLFDGLIDSGTHQAASGRLRGTGRSSGAGGADAEAITALLATGCFERTRLTLAGEPLLDWVSRRLGEPGALRFGRDVHQIVFPGGALLDEILAAAAGPGQTPALVSDLVYRGTIRTDGSALSVRAPHALNNPRRTVVAHGRGVSVIAGWTEAVENALSTGALLLVSALGVLQRARHRAFEALTLNEQTMLGSTADARTLVSELSAQLNELQLDLSFGVEAYIDSVVIPDLVVEAFQASMREGMGLPDALANTSRMLDRLQSVIQARLSALGAAAQEQDEQRHRVFSLVIAAGSLIALPPGLLLAFFGVNGAEVDDRYSIFDLSRYWPAYALAWLPFVVLVLAAFLPLRHIQKRSDQLRVHGRRRRSTLKPEILSPQAPLAATDPLPRQRIGLRPVEVESGLRDRQGET